MIKKPPAVERYDGRELFAVKLQIRYIVLFIKNRSIRIGKA